MGVLDPIDTPPVVREYNKGKDDKVTPAATPSTPKQEERSQPATSNVVQFQQPETKQGRGTEAAFQAIAKLEEERAKPPAPPALPPKPKSMADDIHLWGALAIAFSALASMRTRTPMTTALNAAAAAIQGMQQGDKERTDQAYREWQEQTRIAFQMADYQQRAYEELMANLSRREALALTAGRALDERDYRAAEMQFRTTTAALQDAPMQQAWDEGMRTGGRKGAVEAAAGLYRQREEAARKLKETQASVVQGQMMQEAISEMKKSKEWQEADAANDSTAKLNMIYALEAKMKPGAGSRGAVFSEDDINKTAAAMVAGRQGPPSQAQLFGRYASPSAVAVMDKARELDPTYDPADWPTYVQARKLLQGKDGDNIRAFTVVTHHLAFLDRLKDELKARGVTDFGSQAANHIVSAVAGQFGMPEVTNYEFAQQIVADEVVKAVLGSSVGGVEERLKMGEQLGKQKTPEQIAGIIGTAKTLASGQLAGQLSKYRHFIDKKWLSPDDVIPTKTLKLLGVKPISSEKLTEYGLPQGDSDSSSLDLTDIGLEVPNPNSRPQGKKNYLTDEEAQSRGYRQMRPLRGGGMAYSKTDKPEGPWFDADGNPIGQ